MSEFVWRVYRPCFTVIERDGDKVRGRLIDDRGEVFSRCHDWCDEDEFSDWLHEELGQLRAESGSYDIPTNQLGVDAAIESQRSMGKMARALEDQLFDAMKSLGE